jgi:DNA-binding NarL/FixJ family response regulator
MAAFEDSSPAPTALARVLAVDDHEPFRAVIRRLVEAAAGLNLLGEADSGERAVEAAEELQPDMVVMDVVMPGIGGLHAARRIKEQRPATVVVLVSTTHPDDLPTEAADCRADEIVWKPELRPGLLETIWLDHGGARKG